MLCFGNLGFIDFRQAIHIVVAALDAEVLRKVDDLYFGWDGVLLKELLAFPMAKAEEDDVNIVKGHLVSELQIGIAYKSFMNI